MYSIGVHCRNLGDGKVQLKDLLKNGATASRTDVSSPNLLDLCKSVIMTASTLINTYISHSSTLPKDIL